MDIPYTVKPREDTGLYNAKVGIWLFLASEVMLFGALFSSYILLRVGAPAWPHGLLNVPIGTFNTWVLIFSSVTVVLSWAALKAGNLAKFKVFMGLTILCAMSFLGIKSKEYYDKFTHYQVWLKDGRTRTGHLEAMVPAEGSTPAHEISSPLLWTHNTLHDKKIEEIKLHADPMEPGQTTVWDPIYGKGEPITAAPEGAAKGGHEEHEEISIKTSDIKYLSAYVPRHSTYFAIYFTLTALHALHVFAGALVLAFFWGPGSKMWHTDPERFTNRIEVGGLFWHFVDLVWIFLFPVLYLL